MLNILERYPVGDYGRESSEYWHAWIETKKLVFEDRARFYADPDFVDLPMERLIGKAYAEERQALIEPTRAGDTFSHGNVVIKGSDTTYLSAADRQGLMVSLIQSIFQPFGSGLACPELGFGVQSRGAGFSLEANHPNRYAPGKRPFHPILPAFVMRDDQPWISFGVMGADMQPQGQVQILTNLIDFGMDVQAAGDSARVRHGGSQTPTGLPMEADGGYVAVEAGVSQNVARELISRGHRVVRSRGSFGGYQGILIDPQTNILHGASEARKDGAAVGY